MGAGPARAEKLGLPGPKLDAPVDKLVEELCISCVIIHKILRLGRTLPLRYGFAEPTIGCVLWFFGIGSARTAEPGDRRVRWEARPSGRLTYQPGDF